MHASGVSETVNLYVVDITWMSDVRVAKKTLKLVSLPTMSD